jgi:hypothetical protein
MKLLTNAGSKKVLTAIIASVAIGAPGINVGSNIAGANNAAARTVPSSLPHPHVATPADGTPSGHTGGLMLMREGGLEMRMTPLSGKAPTWSEIQQVYRTVSIAAAATAKYKDLAAAKRDGYVTVPDLFVASQGAHYYSPQYGEAANRGVFDPAHPPFLVYNTMNGHQLARIFPASMASWHQHINVCVGGGTSLLNGTAILHYYDAASCIAHGGHFTGNTGWMVHSWIGQANGSGLFNMDMAQGKAGGMTMMSPHATQGH